jgi:hypothetical protein
MTGRVPLPASETDRIFVNFLEVRLRALDQESTEIRETIGYDRDGRGDIVNDGRLVDVHLQTAGAAESDCRVINAIGPIRQIVQSDVSEARKYLIIPPGMPDKLGAQVQVQECASASTQIRAGKNLEFKGYPISA